MRCWKKVPMERGISGELRCKEIREGGHGTSEFSD